MATKEAIRDAVLAARRAMTADLVHSRSAAIARRVFALPAVLAARTCLAYVSVRNEVETGSIIALLREQGTIVSLPAVLPSGSLCAATAPSSLSNLVTGPFGIPQPDVTQATIVSPRDLDVIFVPGVAFDGSGRRIGFGKGYYDRFLATLPRLEAQKETGTGSSPAPVVHKPTLIGLAFDFQVYPEIPAESHDIPVDAVITESRTYLASTRQ